MPPFSNLIFSPLSDAMSSFESSQDAKTRRCSSKINVTATVVKWGILKQTKGNNTSKTCSQVANILGKAPTCRFRRSWRMHPAPSKLPSSTAWKKSPIDPMSEQKCASLERICNNGSRGDYSFVEKYPVRRVDSVNVVVECYNSMGHCQGGGCSEVFSQTFHGSCCQSMEPRGYM